MAKGLFDCTGKVTVVTGGNGGIGFGFAMGVAKMGGDVAIWARNAEKNAAAKAQLGETHHDLVFLALTGNGPSPAEFLKAGEAQALYLTDPLANWLMVYPANAESTGILKDIKKLLRLSQIG